MSFRTGTKRTPSPLRSLWRVRTKRERRLSSQMSKTLKPSRFSPQTFRAWWAMRSQKRRRAQAGSPALVVPPPVITNGYADWNRTQYSWADVLLEFDFDDPGLPAAVFEIWWMRDTVDSDFHLVGTTPSSQRFYAH